MAKTLNRLLLLSFRAFLRSVHLWHRACNCLGGATRYQVVSSTDGVSGYQGEEGNRIYQALQASHDCSAFYFSTGDCPLDC